MSTAMRLKALAAARLLHPDPAVVTAPLFAGRRPFFLAADKVQVKYEMLRAHVVDGLNVSEAAVSHGYSRPAYYLVADSFAEAGMLGLLDERRGRRGPLKLNAEILAFIRSADPNWSSAALAQAIVRRFAVSLHRRTIERARRQ
jgi:transposase